jgi:hypothetical protein
VSEPSPSAWLRETRRKITSKDFLLLVLGLVGGYAGNALYSGEVTTTVLLLVVVGLTVVACVAIDRFRFEADNSLRASHEEAAGHLVELKRQIDDHHLRLREELDEHLDYVHAAVSFVQDTVRRNGNRANGVQPGYDAPRAAVRRATKSIFVIGDYSPPSDEGLGLDPKSPPEKRSEYLAAIETMLSERLESTDLTLPRLTYRRYIQRPLDIYNEVSRRENAAKPGILLRREDMVGDEQAFDHCARVLKVKADADRLHSDKISIEVRLIPFLPNCPSMLIVDGMEMQFTIPTRIDQPGGDYAALGLLGVLVMQDNAKGTRICSPFTDLFDRLRSFSVFVKGVDGVPPPATFPGLVVDSAETSSDGSS